jgi:hypothetical protein
LPGFGTLRRFANAEGVNQEQLVQEWVREKLRGVQEATIKPRQPSAQKTQRLSGSLRRSS